MVETNIPNDFLFQSGAVMRQNLAFERDARKVYTRAMFEQFGENLYEAGYYDISVLEEGKLYTATHAQAERREKWSRVIFQVKRIDDGLEFDCECGLYAHMGILCCHVLKVVVHTLSCF